MRERVALRRARAFVASSYPDLAGCHIEVALEHDGARSKSWSFGVHRDAEDERADAESLYVGTGYVHADGRVDGLY